MVLNHIGVQTMFMQHWLAAFIVIIGLSFYAWTMFFFKAWVFTISGIILVLIFNKKQDQAGMILEGKFTGIR